MTDHPTHDDIRALYEHYGPTDKLKPNTAVLHIRQLLDHIDHLNTSTNPTDDSNCITLPNGECVSEKPCMHTPRTPHCHHTWVFNRRTLGNMLVYRCQKCGERATI